MVSLFFKLLFINFFKLDSNKRITPTLESLHFLASAFRIYLSLLISYLGLNGLPQTCTTIMNS